MMLKSKYNLMDTYFYNGIHIDCHLIELVEACKYLGILIDENLSWKLHREKSF